MVNGTLIILYWMRAADHCAAALDACSTNAAVVTAAATPAVREKLDASLRQAYSTDFETATRFLPATTYGAGCDVVVEDAAGATETVKASDASRGRAASNARVVLVALRPSKATAPAFQRVAGIVKSGPRLAEVSTSRRGLDVSPRSRRRYFDPPLTDCGAKLARAAGRGLRDRIDPDLILCSVLRRSRETAEAVAVVKENKVKWRHERLEILEAPWRGRAGVFCLRVLGDGVERDSSWRTSRRRRGGGSVVL